MGVDIVCFFRSDDENGYLSNWYNPVFKGIELRVSR